MYKSADSKKEEYKRYLEKTGVTDALTKVMVSLYEEQERPSNAIDYVKKYLGAQVKQDGSSNEMESVKNENEALKLKIRELETEIGKLKQEIAKGEI
ncbi:C-Myc-binding protein-like [Chaetoceros tenuissimus]|uniref:c-Myc-binding protein-like n=1 Tax=Chaetoceros tenuissimus TaxID=426638 RepID=A0AAD3D5A8_9STRA|nr:C-Myc-binding protein-like [Chaetoceros tenuissimus]